MPEPRDAKRLLSAVIVEFRAKELLMLSSAISFRIVLATIPTTLFVIALLGAFGFEELWRQDLAPEVRDNTSAAAFTVIDDAVTRVLEGQNLFWITIGAALALVAMGSVVDAVTRTLNRIHDAEETRPFVERAANAIAIGALAGLLMLAALATVRLGALAFRDVLGDRAVVEVLSFVVRWAIAAGLLVAAVILIVRVAPDLERPMERVTLGAVITVGGWVVASLLFGLYLTLVADYGSIFGQLATFYIAFQYVALAAIVFVAGLVIDAITARGGRFSSGQSG